MTDLGERMSGHQACRRHSVIGRAHPALEFRSASTACTSRADHIATQVLIWRLACGNAKAAGIREQPLRAMLRSPGLSDEDPSGPYIDPAASEVPWFRLHPASDSNNVQRNYQAAVGPDSGQAAPA